jgi:hypothetical protein
MQRVYELLRSWWLEGIEREEEGNNNGICKFFDIIP